MNPRVINVREWVGETEWQSATPYVREAYVRFCSAELLKAKQRQVGETVGADGRQLLRVLPGSRPDGSRDFPLIPHHELSRSLRLLRAIPNVNQGYVTFNWHHWTRVLGYHAAGIPSRLGPRIRDLFGTPGRYVRPVKAKALAYWRQLMPGSSVTVQPSIAARPRRPDARTPAGRLPAELVRNPSSRQTRVFWQ